jgi:DNA-directed RNA polymerase specialized sigma24 family protein
MSRGDRHSRQLVDRIAVGDRAAFRCLYSRLSRRVWHTAIQALPHPADAHAVTRSTFVEVWRLAKHHVNHPPTDIRIWIAAITARKIGERLRTLDSPHAFLGDYDHHVHGELAALLSAGPRRRPNRSQTP